MSQGTRWIVTGLLACLGLLSAGTAEADKGGLPLCQAALATCTTELAACEAQAVCGDGAVGGGEDCDVGTLNGATCQSEGFAGGGVLTCGTGCTFDTSACFATRFVDNDDGTITDHQTGLMWEKQSAGASTGVDSGGVGNCLNCVNDTYTWTVAMSGWLSALNGRTNNSSTQTGYAGYSDWRLPTIVELQTIVDISVAGCNVSPFTTPCVDPIFNDSDSFTAASLYWSSTSWAINPLNAWFVYFFDGSVDNGVKSNSFHARTVRGAP